MSQNAAAHPNMLELFMKHDILSIEFTDLDVPSHFVNENGEIGKEVARKCISNLLVAFDSNTLMHEKIES
ncbi:hypothetical protein ABWK49_27350, partial [Priestia megaterium]